jgi:hypothetical protein
VNEPTVCAIMLTRDRPELVNKAVQCFVDQTYKNKWLAICDSSMKETPGLRFGTPSCVYGFAGAVGRDKSIGFLRNAAIDSAIKHDVYPDTEIIVHFDDDDWSHPNRIAEQVALLQASGADVVGYNEMLFWRKWEVRGAGIAGAWERGKDGEAWLFHRASPSYALGTSLCYWRKTWERKPFPDMPRPGNMGGEDAKWIEGLNVHAVSSLWDGKIGHVLSTNGDPRMIARIHGGNTSRAYETLTGPSWKRVSEWDERVRGVLVA